MPQKRNFQPHPRLYLGKAEHARVKAQFSIPFLEQANEQVKQEAEQYLDTSRLIYRENVHNSLLLRARKMQRQILTLLVRWEHTGAHKYRTAVLENIQKMGEWKYWSWITWRRHDPAPDAIFDLSYGENCATLAIAYDWLFPTLSADEKKMCQKVALARPVISWRKNTRPENLAWWFGKPDSNWNTVCAGGFGMLVLAMWEILPDAPELLNQVENSITPFVQHLDETSGAWPEGIGYWNYGMRYGMMFLASYERALAIQHPLLSVAGLKQTLSFPLNFYPHGIPCSFGDVNRWKPMPFHYQTAERLQATGVIAQIDSLLEQRIEYEREIWPSLAEWLLVHPGIATPPVTPKRLDAAKIYAGMDWGILADQMPSPRNYLAIRGGTSDVPHGHPDLMSFHYVCGTDPIITNLGPEEYLDTTFSPRRGEIFEMTPAAKNVILINGVGIAAKSKLDAFHPVKFRNIFGIRLESTSAMGEMRDGPAAKFCGRLFLLLRNQAILILDQIMLPYVGRAESRMHTLLAVTPQEKGALIQGQQNQVLVRYACNQPAVFTTALTAPTTPSTPGATVLRWCSREQYHTITFATLLAPNVAQAELSLIPDPLQIKVQVENWQEEIAVDARLQPIT